VGSAEGNVAARAHVVGVIVAGCTKCPRAALGWESRCGGCVVDSPGGFEAFDKESATTRGDVDERPEPVVVDWEH